MKIDAKFADFFCGRLKQAFLYLTDKCRLHCSYCLYKTNLAEREIKYETAVEMTKLFYSYGARKMTLLGGEPTLYPHLDRLLCDVKEIGYEYLRVDTNGVFEKDFLGISNIKRIDNLSFSIDDYKEETTSAMRDRDIHEKVLSNMSDALSCGLYVTITACVHKLNVDRIEQVIEYFQNMGVREINLHPMFKVGIDRDNFTGGNHLEPKDWVKKYEDVRGNIDKNKYSVPVRLSPRFIHSGEGYEYCPVRMGERVLVHPNGDIRVCALCIGSRFRIASYDDTKIVWDDVNNELADERVKTSKHFCFSQTKDFDGLTPVCISFKPGQKEYVWEHEGFEKMSVVPASVSNCA
jgi:MoaA/NifB/PqqE/SkfB family radical SAM enzyme